MLNFTIHNRRDHKTLVPWRIHAVNPPDVTYRGFYHEHGSHFMEGGSAHSSAIFELHSTFVGQSKEQMDAVDSDLKVLDVSSVFGPYTKFCVDEIGEPERESLATIEGER